MITHAFEDNISPVRLKIIFQTYKEASWHCKGFSCALRMLGPEHSKISGGAIVLEK